MTLNELMLGNVQSNQGTAVLQIGAQTTRKLGSKSENTAFSDILGSRMSNASDRSNDVKRNDLNVSADKKNNEPLSDKADNKPRYLSFREANEGNLKSSASESNVSHKTKLSKNGDSQLDKVKDDSKKGTVQDDQSNNMLQIFAQVMGLDIRDLQKLLKEAGITSESFNNMQNISENASKLSQLLGLNSEQQDTLVKMLQLTGETLDSLTGTQTGTVGDGILPLDTKSAVDSVETAKDVEIAEIAANCPAGETTKTQSSSAAAGNQDTLSTSDAFDSLATKLNLKIKIKLKDFSNQLEIDQSAVKTELIKLMQPLLEKTALKIQEPLQQVVEVDTGDTEGQIVTVTDAKAETASGEDDGAGQEANAKAKEETVIQQPVTVVKETQPQATFAVVQPDKVNGADVLEKVTAKTPVTMKEIISQVIEKAKVILTPEKSEMVMDLKPDSLGKISLKVVTENGIVMAKFIADSQQVRQVLEANMQLLKDSLEKQGMSVQGFSVSVKQDSNQSARNWTQPEKSKSRSINGAAYRTAGMGGSLANVLEVTGGSNSYQWGSNTINLTA